MKPNSIKGTLIVAAGVLISLTVLVGLWSAIGFAHMGRKIGEEIKQSRDTIELASALSGSLEREDDALLLSMTPEEERAKRELNAQRKSSALTYEKLLPLLTEPAEKEAAAQLKAHVEEYRAKGDELKGLRDRQAAQEFYHHSVNPLLRLAVADCTHIRELNFQSIESAGVAVRDEAMTLTWIVVGILLLAAFLSAIVVARLAKSVVRPIQELSRTVEAIREGRLDEKVPVRSGNELGRLAEGVNRMAEGLAEFRRVNIGEVVRAKERLEATLAALPDAIFLVDPDGQIVSTSPLARKMFGAETQAVRRIYDLLLPTDCLSALSDVLRGTASKDVPTDLSKSIPVTLEGRVRQFLPRALPVPGFSGERTGAVLMFYDVTPFAKLDELRSEMVAVASHELKTPLTTLRMNLHLLGEGMENLSEKQREVLSTALVGCEELSVTVEELLDLTRIEAGQLRLSYSHLDVRAVVSQLAESMKGRFEGAEILLDLKLPDEPVVVHGDLSRLRIAVSNILTNALKYTPHRGRVTIEVTQDKGAGNGQHPSIHLSITDTGPGIAPALREKVFEKFFRVEDGSRGSGGGTRGTGIGLYLCRQIIEAHGGTVACLGAEKEPGARFVISLPGETPAAG